MSKIRIKNFGPIKEGYLENDGWIDIKKVTVFIGNQGSGKSTVAKLISMFTWLEKALNRGDFKGEFSNNDFHKLLVWHRLFNYMTNQHSQIEYIGDCYKIMYEKGRKWPQIEKLDGKYLVPKIMYVPAERNFLSTMKQAFDVAGVPGSLVTFAEEFKRAQFELIGSVSLPFKNLSYHYDESQDISFVSGIDYKINLLEAASGLQSSIPLFLVSKNLNKKINEENDPSTAEVSANQGVRRNREVSNIMMDKSLSNDEKNRQAEEIFAKYHNRCFINIVEEPEQNLFPSSQKEMLNSLIEFANAKEGNKLIMTTHSPYIINYITLDVEAYNLLEKIKLSGKGEELSLKVNNIVPLKSVINPDDLIIYEMGENDGIIEKLSDFEGIPSDKNYLNQSLREGNIMFDSLLEIEEEI